MLVHVKRLSQEINEFRSTFNTNKLKNIASVKEISLGSRFKSSSVKQLAEGSGVKIAVRNSSLKMEKIETESKLNLAKNYEKNYSSMNSNTS